MDYQVESLGEGLTIRVSPAHKFGSDAILLAHFSQVRGGETACDLGTGCGIIPLLWMRGEHRPGKAYGVELQPEGAALFQGTVEDNRLEGRVIPILGDLRRREDLPPADSCTLVTCNPPYQPAGHGILSPDGSRRAARHQVACSLEEVCEAAARLLRFGGRFCLCQRPERLVDVLTAMRQAGLEPKRLQLVQQRPEKAPWLILCEGKKGAKPFMRVLPPLLMEDEAGGLSPQLREIYRLPAEGFPQG